MKKSIANLTAFLLILISITSCDTDKIDQDNLYTFTDQMVGEYLEADTTLSVFADLVKKTQMMGLLKSYGFYTCFAPTNQALREYLALKGRNSFDEI